MWELLFNHPRAAFESGTLVFTNVGEPLWWWAGAALAAAIVLASVLTGRRTRDLAWWRQGTLAALQTAVVLGVIALLAGPALEIRTLTPGANHVAVLADVSGSMGYANEDTPDAPSRLTAATTLMTEALLPSLSPLADVTVFRFDTSASRLDGPAAALLPGAPQTHLIRAVDTVLASFQGAPLAAVVVLSDGADTESPGPAELTALAAHGVPVHTVGFGPATLAGETRLTDVEFAAEAPPDSRVTARLVIDHAGQNGGGGQALLRVRDAGTLIAAQTITLPADAPTVRTEIDFDAGEAGIRELSFELTPPPGDRLAENNRIDRLLTVSERRRRILYLEGEPRWEYKFLRRAVAGDDVITLVSWLKTTDRKTYRQGVADEGELADGFPVSREALFGYDVVVLGSLAATALTAEQHTWLEAFVSERGGSVLALAGREALDDGRWDVQPLAAALPVAIGRPGEARYTAIRGQARPTLLGSRSPYTRLVDAEGSDGWSTLPELGDLQRLGELKPAATTLLELATADAVHPLLVIQPYGLGTTAVLATASTWRWQMRTPPDDHRHALFWRQLLRQLAETAQQQRSVSLSLADDGISIRAWLRDAAFRPEAHATATALVTHPDRTTAMVTLAPGSVPGQLSGRYEVAGPGVYRVDVTLTEPGGATETVTRFLRAGTGDREAFQPTRNGALLARIAELTGGRYFADGDVSALDELLAFSGTGVRSVAMMPLTNLPILFLLLVAAKLAEWGLRRRWGRI
ncbi:MAG: hypothetical protein AB7I04_02445 [Pseudomonadales bacterium]